MRPRVPRNDDLFELPLDPEEDEPTELEPDHGPRRRSPAREAIVKILLAVCGVLVFAEVVLQLPPVREIFRAKAEAALAKRIPGATVRRCAAADITGVVRFDGVRIPAGSHAALTLDGLEITPRFRSLFAGHLVPARVFSEDVTVSVGGLSWGPAPGAHFSLDVHDPARFLALARATPAASPSPAPSPAAPRPAASDLRLTMGGTSALCRDATRVTAAADASGLAADGERHCIAAQTHVEVAMNREGDNIVARFQALGDRVRVASETEPVPLPPLAANGVLERVKGGRTAAKIEISVGPHGTIDVATLLDGDAARAVIDATTDSYAALVASLPLPLPQVRELGVDGPVHAHARFEGPPSDPQRWEVEMKLDLAKLRAKSAKAGAGALLRSPQFVWRPKADPNAPAAGILMGPGNPDFVPLEKLPQHVILGVLLCEDSDFYTHSGFDIEAIVNAFKQNLKADKIRRGGSTITQQLAKNLWLSRERTFRRKLEEALLTVALEAAVPKDRLLEIYLNGIEWGPGIYGIGPAARHYFGKDATQLTPKEAAFLGTIIPNPRYYYVYYRRGSLTENWNDHVMTVLTKMHETGALSDEALADAFTTQLKFRSSNAVDPWAADASTGAP